VLIDYGKKLNYVGEQGVSIFNQQREELELDNFNILYVALTRAVEQLYIISEKVITVKKDENLNFTSGLLINFLKQQNVWDDSKIEFNFGDPKRIHCVEKTESTSTFQTSFISNSWKNHNISIVTSSSLLWDTEQGKSISYGNLFHEILSKIKTESDVSEVVSQYVFNGIISNEKITEISETLHKVINHPELSVYFNQNNQVYLEQQLITKDKHIVIPDRIVTIDGVTTIIDYKTGKSDTKYHTQINNYAQVLEELNFKIDKKLLVYINDEIIVEEV
jgi:ATP-dependent exoDNAse (exonuclease V) beta subunit